MGKPLMETHRTSVSRPGGSPGSQCQQQLVFMFLSPQLCPFLSFLCPSVMASQLHAQVGQLVPCPICHHGMTLFNRVAKRACLDLRPHSDGVSVLSPCLPVYPTCSSLVLTTPGPTANSLVLCLGSLGDFKHFTPFQSSLIRGLSSPWFSSVTAGYEKLYQKFKTLQMFS